MDEQAAKALIGKFFVEFGDWITHEVMNMQVDERFPSGWSVNLKSNAYPGIAHSYDPGELALHNMPAASHAEAVRSFLSLSPSEGHHRRQRKTFRSNDVISESMETRLRG